MSRVTLGYYAVHKAAIHESEALSERVARLLTDDRWPWRSSLVRRTQFPGRPLYPFRMGRLPASELFPVVRDLLRSPDALGANLVSGTLDRNQHTWFNVDSGQSERWKERMTYPFLARALCRTYDLPAGKSVEGWIGLMHELSVAIDTPNAVILAFADERPLIAMLYSSGGGPFRVGEHRDTPRYEIHRVSMARDWLGGKFTRPPGWGTYLAPEHLAAIGGREKIAEVAQPAVMRDVGRLLYVQLSERAEDALQPEIVARKRALWELMEPVTVPHQAIG